jgi:hypothetical protein
VNRPWAHRENKAPTNYEAQSGDRFNDLKRSLIVAPVCLHGFFAFSAGLDRSAARLTLGSTGLPFLLAAIDEGCLDFPTDEVVAFASCQCRLMIFGSTGGTIVATGEIDGSVVGCNADWAGVT